MASLHDMSDAVDHATSAAYNTDLTPLLAWGVGFIILAFGLWVFKLVVIAANEIIKEFATLVRGWIAAWAK